MFDLAKLRLRRDDKTGWMRTLVLTGVIWSALVDGSLVWYMHLQQQNILSSATAAARANINKDMNFRRWATLHGGVYVPPTEHTPPNPYLHVPNRDVVTTTGKMLTLMNPAYMLRQMQSDFPGEDGTRSHLTSLKLFNPDNAPDAWEAKALHGFEQGGKELLEQQQIDGQPYLRMMLPLIVEQGCLKCHAQQGYKLGDIRGGISSAVPLALFLARERKFRGSLVLGHAAIWLLGLAGLVWLGVSFRRVERLEITSSTTAAIEENERRFRAVAESANDAIISADSTGKIMGWNPSAEQLFGYTEAEIIGQPLTVLMPERFRDIHRADLTRVVAGGVSHVKGKTVEFTGLRKDGSEFPLEISRAQWETSAGRFFTAIIRDITQRRQTEDALRASSENLHRLLNSITEGAYGVDINGNCTFVNLAFLQMLGYRNDGEVLGKNIHALIHHFHADGSPYPDSECNLYRAYRNNQSSNASDEVFWRKDGIAIPVEYWSHPIETDEAVIGAIVTFVDITERKRSESGMKEMLKAANQSRQAMLSMIEDKKQAEDEVLKLNAELEKKVIARTADLEQARHDAEEANKAKSAFLAAMSHEIRTPMNGVIGMIDVLQQSSLTGPQVEMASIIHDSAFSLLSIIDDILDFSKIEAGKLLIDSLPMSISDVVEGTCETMGRIALKKGVELTLFTDPAIPATVMGDPGRLRQILVNLTSNAIKFSSGQKRQQQGKVSVRALLADGSTSSPRTVEGDLEQILLEFRVTDNGIGIDEATQARLFTPFTQADTSTTRNFGGSGLGLVISRRLASILSGEITVQSEPGKGSMFSVFLPFKLAQDVGRMSVALSAEEDCRKALHFSDLQELPCLVVGDSESMADDLAAYLAHGEAVVERAEDLAAAREWITSRPPGLCVVVIDTAGVNPPLDELRAAARTRPNLDIRFVTIERGGRQRCRVEATDHVALDAEVMHRRAFLEAVAIAAGRVKQSDLEGKHRDANAKPLLSREEARRRNSLILIAEDNEINQKVILQQLMLLGQTADVANNGREALELWRSGDYGLLLSDLHMPEMDGYELTEAIRAAEIGKAHIPIIAFTANALKGEAERCRAIGMDDYISKPVQLVNLKAMLGKWMPVVAGETAVVGRALPADEKICRAAPKVGNPLRDKSRVELTQPDLQLQGNMAVDVNVLKPGSPHDNAGSAPGLHPGYIAPTSAPVDVNVLKALIGDDEAMIREFLHDFRLSAAKIAVELRTACAAGQAAAAGALAHKLKSSSRSVGALALGELCAAMEKAGKGGDTAALAALLPRFEQELASVEHFLEEY